MEYKKIGDGRIPVLGIGTWGIGGKIEREKFTQQQRQQWVRVIREAIMLGMAHIDASEIYAAGLAEELIGEAIKDFPREQLFITTKAGREHLSSYELVKACERSLKRLGTGYVDLYMPQRQIPEVPIAETMKALQELHEKGLIRHIGVSNFTKSQITEAQNNLKREQLRAVQDEYNLLCQNKELLKLCKEQKLLLIAYRPLAKGKLAKQGIAMLDETAAKYGKTPAQAALNWLISKEPVVAIPKASKREHMLDNLGALGWKMSEEDCEKLEAVGMTIGMGSHSIE